MIILPAIDILGGKCVRLFRGNYETAEKVAEDPVKTVKYFEDCGAECIHMVDLDGAKNGIPYNTEIFLKIVKNINIPVELGGGIRNMETISYYIENGISRIILGSAVLQNKELVKEAVLKYGEKIAVGIDANNRKVKTKGWFVESEVDFLELADEMVKIGIKNIIYTDISKDGTLSGVNLCHYEELKSKLPSDINIIASGGVKDIEDIKYLDGLGIYGVICGKAIYSGGIDLKEAVIYSKISKLFKKNKLIPAVIQDYKTNEVLMLAYMNEESLKLTLKTGQTWFYSRSRQELWHKGKTHGHFQNVKNIYYDCEDNSFLIKVEQIGVPCHTGKNNCFFNKLI